MEWDAAAVELRSYFSEKGRGLELSELQFFDGACMRIRVTDASHAHTPTGKLYAVDDRTGIIYEVSMHACVMWR